MSESAEDVKNRIEIDLVDYGRARDEIDKRTELSAQLLNFHVVIVAAVFSGYDKLPHESLLAVSCVASIFWLMWIDHTAQIYKLAAYVELVVARRLRAQFPHVLGWEYFMRQLDGGPVSASLALFGKTTQQHLHLPKTIGITSYILLLFLGSALGFAAVYVQAFWGSAPAGPWKIDLHHTLFLVASLLLLAYAIWAHRRLVRTTKILGMAITNRGNAL